MTGGGVQLRVDADLPLDPLELAALSIFERTKLYTALDLHAVQIAAAEDAIRAVQLRKYGRRHRG